MKIYRKFKSIQNLTEDVFGDNSAVDEFIKTALRAINSGKHINGVDTTRFIQSIFGDPDFPGSGILDAEASNTNEVFRQLDNVAEFNDDQQFSISQKEDEKARRQLGTKKGAARMIQSSEFESVDFISVPGVGKSSLIHAWVDKYNEENPGTNLDLIQLNLAGANETTFAGYPSIDHESGMVKFYASSFVIDLLEHEQRNQPYVIFFDEFNRSRPVHRTPAGELIRAHKLILNGKVAISPEDAEKDPDMDEVEITDQDIQQQLPQKVYKSGTVYLPNLLMVIAAQNPDEEPEISREGLGRASYEIARFIDVRLEASEDSAKYYTVQVCRDKIAKYITRILDEYEKPTPNTTQVNKIFNRIKNMIKVLVLGLYVLNADGFKFITLKEYLDAIAKNPRASVRSFANRDFSQALEGSNGDPQLFLSYIRARFEPLPQVISVGDPVMMLTTILESYTEPKFDPSFSVDDLISIFNTIATSSAGAPVTPISHPDETATPDKVNSSKYDDDSGAPQILKQYSSNNYETADTTDLSSQQKAPTIIPSISLLDEE